MKPKISIIIPARNEEQFIAGCLDSILNNSIDAALVEVFVVDGMSEDQSRKIVQKFSDNYPSVHLLDNPRKSTPFALNIGILRAVGDYIMILGAHSELSGTYLKDCLTIFAESPEIGCVGGRMDSVFENDSSRIISLAMSSPFGVGNVYFRTGLREGFVDTVAFGMYRREVVEKVGLFDEKLVRNQDDEYNYRVLKNNYKIFLSQKLNCKYYVRASFKKLLRQYFQYGYWKVFVGRKHRALTSFRQLVPFLWVCFLILGLFLSVFCDNCRLVFYSILSVYLIFALIFARKKSSDFMDIIKICYTFFILHLSYGYGYFVGVYDFIILRKEHSNEKCSKMTR